MNSIFHRIVDILRRVCILDQFNETINAVATLNKYRWTYKSEIDGIIMDFLRFVHLDTTRDAIFHSLNKSNLSEHVFFPSS